MIKDICLFPLVAQSRQLRGLVSWCRMNRLNNDDRKQVAQAINKVVHHAETSFLEIELIQTGP
jgi:hypothetical protein